MRDGTGRTISKIKNIDELVTIVASLHLEKRKIVHCHGVFDLLHVGHIRHFEQAKKLGEVLVVTVTSDRYVNKGPHRPVFGEHLRAEAIAALDCVDYVAVNRWSTAVETIRLLKPDIYVKGVEYRDQQRDLTGKIVDEEEAVKSVGGEITFTDDIVFSSSSLINKYLPVFPEAVREYLSGFSKRHPSEEVLQYLKDAKRLKVLLVGETIIDEYHYCESIGKSTKDPVLAVRYVSSEKFAGGALALANHLANFCDHVGIVTMLGEQDSQEAFVRQSVSDNVNKMFLYKRNSPTIVKRRFVESYLLQKLFEVYEMNDEQLSLTQEQDLCEMLGKVVPEYDVVIVVDYGHGMLGTKAIDLLCRQARFLAVNTQVNAGNRGLNTISTYPRADYVCLAHHEIVLDQRRPGSNLREMILNVSHKLDCGRVVVTRGNNGNLCYSEDEGFVEVPAFAHQVVDRIGAGDAALSLTSLCVAGQASMEVVGFIGNVVGAEAVATVGHRRPIERTPLFKHIESLLK